MDEKFYFKINVKIGTDAKLYPMHTAGDASGNVCYVTDSALVFNGQMK